MVAASRTLASFCVRDILTRLASHQSTKLTPTSVRNLDTSLLPARRAVRIGQACQRAPVAGAKIIKIYFPRCDGKEADWSIVRVTTPPAFLLLSAHVMGLLTN